jgi:hypothetical protein
MTTPGERSGHHGRSLAPPGPVDAVTDTGHGPGDLVAEHGTGGGQLAGQMEIATADATARDPEQRLARCGRRDRDVGQLEPRTILGQHCGTHVLSPR